MSVIRMDTSISSCSRAFSSEQLSKIQSILMDYGARYNGYAKRMSRDDAWRCRIQQALNQSGNTEDSFFIVDLGAAIRQMARWKANFPRIKPFYAVKCNGNPALLAILEAVGCGFDCASVNEFNTILSMGVDPSRIIFANPCKQVNHIRAARDSGLSLVTFDSEYELQKLKTHWPAAELLLRIRTDDSAAVCEFSTKFGASLEIVPKLLDLTKSLGLNLVGVSFHVGSGCGDANAFVKAAADARWVFDQAALRGIKMSILDIGGGFPGSDDVSPSFEEIAAALSPRLDEWFPHTRIIAEPGRFFACSTHTLVCNVFAKREIELCVADHESVQPSKVNRAKHQPNVECQYYINDGVYQSFNCILFDHVHITAETFKLLKPPRPGHENIRTSTVFGPTCDALDCIVKRVPLPEMQLGDWIFFTDFGAYTCAAASKFNGFGDWKIQYICSVDVMEEVHGMGCASPEEGHAPGEADVRLYCRAVEVEAV
eukprot:NODE_193_length_1849_cov_1197.801111_g145_i0.p1 GENE.NODE_193_length_1849_cov_1197.801111_g145_i0~~NODE_193_length_1849_cov_1197.801111_g145_i0.p1  ORF type:complete len:485 (+),score=87.89 NODE_193_length_1849_cov_1197.801111_g145_i0:113-1567(+)